jgi:hypothetical protein
MYSKQVLVLLCVILQLALFAIPQTSVAQTVDTYYCVLSSSGGSGLPCYDETFFYEDSALTQRLDVRRKGFLSVGTGVTLTVELGVILSIDGWFRLDGTIVNNGTIEFNGTAFLYGDIENNGTIEIMGNVFGSGTVTNHGTIIDARCGAGTYLNLANWKCEAEVTPADLSACQSSLTSVNANLTACSTNLTTANANLATANSDLTTANANLATCSTDLTTANANLATCSTDQTTANANLATCSTDLTTANSDLTTANANLATCSTDLTTANSDLTTANATIATCSTGLELATTDLAACNTEVTYLEGLIQGEGETFVCHKPGTEKQATQSVSASKLQSHLKHGDTLGACES